MRLSALCLVILGCSSTESDDGSAAPLTLDTIRAVDARIERDLSRARRELGGSFAPTSPPLAFSLPAEADGALLLTDRTGATITARRIGFDGALSNEDAGVVTYADERGPRVVSFRKGLGLEELFIAHDSRERLGYALELPAGYSIERESETTVVLRDDRAEPMIRVAVPLAWELDGDPIDVRWRVEGSRLMIEAPDDVDYPVVIDPTWSTAGVPLKLRMNHTSTLLPDGRVFVVGGPVGSSADVQTEIYDPFTGEAELGPVLDAGRVNHTSTLLLDGRVMIAGGANTLGDPVDSTVFYDSSTGLVSDGPAMSTPRLRHVAEVLSDGRVLFVGGGSAEIFDPAANTFSDLAGLEVSSASITSLVDGRVLIVGLDAQSMNVAFLFDPPTNNSVATGAPSLLAGALSLTTLRDGRVLAHGSCPCFSTGGPFNSAPEAELWSPQTNTFLPTDSLQSGRLGHTASMLPDGRVVFVGGDNNPDNADVFDPVTETFTRLPDNTIDDRTGHTATILPSGSLLIIGGTQASTELFLDGASVQRASFQPGPTMTTGREAHSATMLRDGRVLFAGGDLFGTDPLESAELLSANGAAITPTGAMNVLRALHTATLLNDGRVLIAGGVEGFTVVTGTTELFDPATETFSMGDAMTTPRQHHTETLLADGTVLIAGGSDGTSTLSSAELFDPTTGSFTATGDMPIAMSEHRATLLASGKVLLASANAAQFYDPLTQSFTVALSPSTVHGGISLATLASGRVVLWGGDTKAAELLDPATELYSFSSEGQSLRRKSEMTVSPVGEVIVTGGYNVIGVLRFPTSTTERFDPVGGLAGSFVTIDATGSPLYKHRGTTLRGGQLLLSGGTGCFDLCLDFPHANTELLDGVSNAFRPTIASAPMTADTGTAISITGTRFRGLGANGGQTSSGTSNHPIAFWQSLTGTGVLVGRTTAWTDTTATIVLPATAFTGAGFLRVAVNGMVSDGELMDLRAAADAVPCSFDAECGSAHCSDGVCCDSICDGDCSACTAELKGSGEDGVCGDVPPERSLTDACEVSTGAPCTDGGQCSTGFCVDGVCCLSECPAQCEACDVSGSFGTCVPVTGAPHGDRPACDAEAPEDPCDAAICDGLTRTECAETIGPCGAYACGPENCLESCVTDAECAVGFHCEDGECVAGQCTGSIATTPDGDEVDCAPYNCRSDGTCKTSCSDVSDCAAPSACDFEGRCVPRPPADVDSGCGCSLTRRSETGWLSVALLGLLVFARRRRVRHAVVVITALFVMSHVGIANAQPATPAAPQAEKPPAAADKPNDASPTKDNADKEAAREEAKRRFERGIGLVNERSWDAALAEFSESVRLFPTRGARQNAAFCLRELTRYDESLSEYEGLLRDYPDMDDKKKKEATDALSALRDLVGSIEIDAAEPGASIVIDGRQRGIYPAPAPFRVPAGSHVVRVFMKGFAPFETRVDVPSRQIQRVSVSMVALTESGTLKITEKTGKAVKVFVDQVEVGVTPYEGTLGIGAHVVWLRGEGTLGVAPTAAPIERDRVTALELEAVPLDAALRVEPTPAGALVKIDGVEVGLGTWEGSLPAGDHIVELSSSGYLTQRKNLSLAKDQPTTVRVTLDLNPDEEPFRLPGEFTIEAVGGVNLFPGYFGEPNNGCDGDCSASVGLGGSALLHVSFAFSFGLAVGVTGGWFSAQQSVDSRQASVQPVGLPARQGAVDDDLSVTGGLVGAHIAYRIGTDVPVTFRLTGGALLAETRDARTGRFTLDDGFVYQAGPAIESEFSPAVAVLPEVRVAYKFTEDLEASLGVSATVLIPIEPARWDPSRELDAATDGIGAFGAEDLTGPVWFTATPGLGARYAF